MVKIIIHDLLLDDFSFEYTAAQTEGINQSPDLPPLQLTGAICIQLAELPVDFCLIEELVILW